MMRYIVLTLPICKKPLTILGMKVINFYCKMPELLKIEHKLKLGSLIFRRTISA